MVMLVCYPCCCSYAGCTVVSHAGIIGAGFIEVFVKEERAKEDNRLSWDDGGDDLSFNPHAESASLCSLRSHVMPCAAASWT
jgi:hypothetical protein